MGRREGSLSIGWSHALRQDNPVHGLPRLTALTVLTVLTVLTLHFRHGSPPSSAVL